jgi:hypothetical protein
MINVASVSSFLVKKVYHHFNGFWQQFREVYKKPVTPWFSNKRCDAFVIPRLATTTDLRLSRPDSPSPPPFLFSASVRIVHVSTKHPMWAPKMGGADHGNPFSCILSPLPHLSKSLCTTCPTLSPVNSHSQSLSLVAENAQAHAGLAALIQQAIRAHVLLDIALGGVDAPVGD